MSDKTMARHLRHLLVTHHSSLSLLLRESCINTVFGSLLFPFVRVSHFMRAEVQMRNRRRIHPLPQMHKDAPFHTGGEYKSEVTVGQ